MSPSNNNNHTDRGYIIPIGGAEEKFHNPEILDRFVEICGGKSARIGIIPTASELEDTGRNYEKLFRKLGIRHAEVLQMITREDCKSSKYLDYIEKADGIFMTGGNQLRLSTTLGGTPVAQMIRRRNANGMHVAGTSAGAAFMPEHMIAGGDEGSTPSPTMVTMAPGLDSPTISSLISTFASVTGWDGCLQRSHTTPLLSALDWMRTQRRLSAREMTSRS